MKAMTPSGYAGLDISQVIFGIMVLVVFALFMVWGLRTRKQIKNLERQLRDFQELEPEGYDEEGQVDALSEGAMMEADEEAARQRDALEHGA
jgi:hypothetical protein